jgi:hypothetical protein
MNKRFAAACVISKLVWGGKVHTRIFLAGLLDWSGGAYPTGAELTRVRILESGATHVKTITENGGHILGVARINGIHDSPITKTDDIHTWGFSVVKVLAEKYFGTVS